MGEALKGTELKGMVRSVPLAAVHPGMRRDMLAEPGRMTAALTVGPSFSAAPGR